MKKSSKLRAIITLLIVACTMLTLFACSVGNGEGQKPTTSSQETSVENGSGSTDGGNPSPTGTSSSKDEPTSSSSEGEPTSSSSKDEPTSSSSEGEPTSSSSEDEPTSSSSEDEPSSSSGGGSSDDPTPTTDYEKVDVPNGYKEFKSFIKVSDHYTINGKPAAEIVDGIWTIQTDAEFRTRNRSWAKTSHAGYDYVDARKMLDGKTSYDFTHSVKLANGKGLKVNVPGKGYLVLYVSNGSSSVTGGEQKISVNGTAYAFPANGGSDPVVQVVVAVDKGECVVGRPSGTVDLFMAELHCVEPSGTVEPTPGPDPTPTEYTYTFVTNGGTAVDSIVTDKLTELPTTTREGYKFMGWFDNADFNGESIVAPYTATGNVTLYAKWEKEGTVEPTPDPAQEIKTFINISDYSANAGSTTSSEITSGVWTISSGVEIRSRSKSWKKTGYPSYDYIDTRATLDGKTNLSFTHSIKLTASDKGLKVNVPGKGYLTLYVQNGSSTATEQKLKVNNNTYDVLITNSPVVQVLVPVEKGEYLVSTANKTIDLYYAELQCGGSSTDPTPTTKYKFTFEENGGESVADVTAEKLTELPTPVKSGYKFLGWFDNADLTGNAVTVPYAPNKDVTLYAKWEKESTVDPTPDPAPVTKYKFTFEENGGESVADVTAEELTELPTPIRDGYKFMGWFDNADLTGNAVTVPYAPNKDVMLYAKWEKVVVDTNYLVESKGLSETAYVIWKDANPASAKAYYKKSSDTNYTVVDSELIRNIGNGQARVDVLGLAAGTYDIKITVGSGGEFVCSNISVNSYDRSGYAHFGYTSGVGAYNDDGTLKSNVKVVYITEATKNTAGGGVVKALQSGNVCVRIIGRVTTDTRKSASTWDGKYTKISGLREGANSGEGTLWGLCEVSKKSNITFEGVGSDAEIYQWGVSFKRCNSIEVRNLTFTNYPEDACEFNGGSNDEMTQYGNYWVHNNVFNQGMRYFDDSTDGDKKEGDGAIDLKYCHNATYSYNKVANCHKTGLIGGSDKNEQKNITFHHNYFYKNSSRMPLGRSANMHYYNNYYESIGGTCMSIRGNGYVFSEANYFYKSKNPFEIKSGGAVKSFNDVLDGCSGTQSQVKVTDRTKAISNNCVYGTSFDTDSSKFYYDSSNKVSKVRYLTSAQQAKTDCVQLAGPGKANK